MKRLRSIFFAFVLIALVLVIGGLVARRLVEEETTAVRAGGPTAVPVEVAPVTRGPIENRRVFSGSLEATATVTLASKVSGLVERLTVDLADRVERGQVIAQLDDDEARQGVMQARAELAVASAGLVEAENALTIASRELERVRTLNERGIASESQFDTVRADELGKRAALEVAKAQVTRAEAALASAEIRLGYTTVEANWAGGADTRIVSRRHVEEGDTVSANAPLVTIIELDPIRVVIFATERDYADLSAGQRVTIGTDAYPGRAWDAAVTRVSPVFREGSRQARVEIRTSNPDGALKPGMFVRAVSVLGRVDEATIVPVEAIAERGGRSVVFVVDEAAMAVRMTPVELGIRNEGRVQILGDAVTGRVVTLGQQLLKDGTEITIPSADVEIAP